MNDDVCVVSVIDDDQTCVVCILFAHLTLLPPDDPPDDDDAVVVFDVFKSSLKFDFMAVGLALRWCWRSKELFSSAKMDAITNGNYYTFLVIRTHTQKQETNLRC